MPDRFVTCHELVPAAELYCTDQPARITAELLLLYNSIKSFLYNEPPLPPPPYTSLITIDGSGSSSSKLIDAVDVPIAYPFVALFKSMFMVSVPS